MTVTKYSQQQIDKVLKTLPEELYEALFSVETADNLWNIYEKHGIMDARAHQISEYAGYVLMGLSLPQEFLGKLQKEVRLSEEIAKELSREINRLVFYPVKPALEQLHRMEIEVSAKIVTPKPEEEGQPGEQEPSEKPREDDSYREPLE